MRRLPLYNREGVVVAHALVDDADYARVARWRWCLMKRSGYAKRGTTGNRTVLLHREVMGVTDPAVRVDHEDRNKLNCQRSNLRLADAVLNGQNLDVRRDNATGYRGVGFVRRTGKWRARVCLRGQMHELGQHATPELAHAAATAFRAQHMPYSPEAANREEQQDGRQRRIR